MFLTLISSFTYSRCIHMRSRLVEMQKETNSLTRLCPAYISAMRGHETSLQIEKRALQADLDHDRGSTGRSWVRFGREVYGDIVEQGDSHRAFPCCQADQVLDSSNPNRLLSTHYK